MEIGENETVNFEETAPVDSRSFSPRPISLEPAFGARSHLGNVRRNNEDHFAVIQRKRSRKVLLTNMPPEDLSLQDDLSYVLIVADGMGGAAFGELASRMVLRTADELVGNAGHWITRLQDIEPQQTEDRIQTCAHVIQQTLLDFGQSDPRLTGMGTTLTCALVQGSDVIVAHVGDSRAYHISGGRVRQVTRDQTLAQELIESGMAREETVRFRHILTNCFGGEARDVRTDVHQFQLQGGDSLLLCTDGLSDLIEDGELALAVESEASAQAACDRLLSLALDRGGKDNITVVLGRFRTAEQAAQSVQPAT